MYFNETHDAFRASIKKFVDKEINPHMTEWEENDSPPSRAFQEDGRPRIPGHSL